jgi:hypothetical protein
MAEYFTTQSGGSWLFLFFLWRLRVLQMVFEFAQAAVHTTATFSPLATLLPDHTTPELLFYDMVLTLRHVRP